MVGLPYLVSQCVKVARNWVGVGSLELCVSLWPQSGNFWIHPRKSAKSQSEPEARPADETRLSVPPFHVGLPAYQNSNHRIRKETGTDGVRCYQLCGLVRPEFLLPLSLLETS
jgi:hypothetical protein